jgi:hypothetical protein
VRLWIDDNARSQFPMPKPYVRGLEHLVFAAFDSSSSLLVDLNKKHVMGRFSRDLSLDCGFWKTIFFPILMTVIGGSIGIAELHCSCVVKNNKGLLLLGPSHSGKSTLATALALSGFEFLSDDRAYCALRNGSLQAWGIPNFLKLRPEAQSWFPQLHRAQPMKSIDGEAAFLVQPDLRDEVRAAKHCEPAMLVFLDQQQSDQFRLSKAEPSQVFRAIDSELIADRENSVEQQCKVADRLSRASCWHLIYGGKPQTVAASLANHFETIIGHA